MCPWALFTACYTNPALMRESIISSWAVLRCSSLLYLKALIYLHKTLAKDWYDSCFTGGEVRMGIKGDSINWFGNLSPPHSPPAPCPVSLLPCNQLDLSHAPSSHRLLLLFSLSTSSVLHTLSTQAQPFFLARNSSFSPQSLHYHVLFSFSRTLPPCSTQNGGASLLCSYWIPYFMLQKCCICPRINCFIPRQNVVVQVSIFIFQQ